MLLAFRRNFLCAAVLGCTVAFAGLIGVAHADQVVATAPVDLLTALAATPVGNLAPYFAYAVAIATVLLLALPAPGATSSAAYATIYNLIHAIANLKSWPGMASIPAKAPPAAGLLLMLGLAGFTLSACTPAQEAQAMKLAQDACKQDKILQPGLVAGAAPIAALVAPGAAPVTATVVAADQQILHPLVQAECGTLPDPVPPVTKLAP